ncbi:MAG: hypothetical protein PXY39_15100 [archaeon]|nr:hypothetical protein [archaeon]
MKISFIVMIVSVVLFGFWWLSIAQGLLITINRNFLALPYTAIFLAIVSLYLKLREMDKKKVATPS